jgi:hypothetical protein
MDTVSTCRDVAGKEDNGPGFFLTWKSKLERITPAAGSDVATAKWG